MASIDDLRLVVDTVTIDDSFTFIIKLSILKEFDAELPLLSSTISLKIGSRQKDVKYILIT